MTIDKRILLAEIVKGPILNDAVTDRTPSADDNFTSAENWIPLSLVLLSRRLCRAPWLTIQSWPNRAPTRAGEAQQWDTVSIT